MFRHTITFLLIFLVLNHDFAAARDFNIVPRALIKQPWTQGVVKERTEGRYRNRLADCRTVIGQFRSSESLTKQAKFKNL